MPFSLIQPPELWAGAPAGMSHVGTASGTLVLVSGQVALDKDLSIVGGGDIEAQTVAVFENLGSALAAAGVGFEDVVRLGAFFADRMYLTAYREVRKRYFKEPYPVSTGVVAELIMPELLIEIEAMAVVPE